MLQLDQFNDVMGTTAYDSDGDKIGKVGQVYLDDATGEASWVTVSTGLFGNNETFVPAADASLSEGRLTLPFDKQKVKDAPNVDTGQHLSPQEEQELYAYYGMDYDSGTTGDHGTDYVAPVSGDVDGSDSDRRDRSTDAGVQGRDTSGPTTDTAMTRSEERLDVGTERVETGKAKLRKFVVTENVTQTVPVSHEEVTLEREPITDTNRGDALSGADLTSEEHEVTLHAERAVVDKETVPVERVRLGSETVTEEQTVTEQVGKEQIELVEDADRENRTH